MNEYKLFGQRIGLIGLTNLLLSISGIILLPVLTKNLPVEDYGAWVQIMALIGLIIPFAGMGLSYTMVRFLAAEKDKRKIQEGFYSTGFFILLTSLIASFILFIFSKPFAVCFLDDRAYLVKIISLIIPVVCLNGLFLSFFRTFQQTKKYSFFVLLSTYGMIAMVAYSVFLGYGVFGAVLSYSIAQIIVFLLMGALIVSEIGVKMPAFSQTEEYLSFSLPLMPGIISSWVVMLSDRYLIGYFLGVAFVGYYAPGYGVGALVGMFMAPLGFLLPPALSKLYDEGKYNDVRTYLKYCLKYFLMLAVPSAFGLSLLSKQLLIILSTAEIASQGYLITPFVALSTVLYGVYAIVSHILILVKKTKIIGGIWMVAAGVNLGLNFIFIPYLGILGAAITTLIAYALAFGFAAHYSFKYFKFNVDFHFILKSIFASAVMSLVLIKWMPVGALNVLIATGVCAFVYVGVLLLLKGVEKEEIGFFRGVFKI